MKLDEPTIRAALIAHAIRLGKCPAVGMVIDFKLGIEDIEQEDLDAGRLDKAVPRLEAQRTSFVVSAADIAAGKKMINDQTAVYSEPKLTKVKL